MSNKQFLVLKELETESTGFLLQLGQLKNFPNE